LIFERPRKSVKSETALPEQARAMSFLNTDFGIFQIHRPHAHGPYPLSTSTLNRIDKFIH
jgi:hypothetical protein